MGDIRIEDVQFAQAGVLIQYIEIPDDVRVKGKVIRSHMVQISAEHPDYAEDIEKLHGRAVKLLRNALEDFEASEPHSPGQDDIDEDDDRGMGE